MNPTTEVSDSLLDDTRFDVPSNATDCSIDSGPAAVPVEATSDAQLERFNAWVAMLRWYELPQPLIH